MKLVISLVVATLLAAALALPCNEGDSSYNPDLNERWELYKVTSVSSCLMRDSVCNVVKINAEKLRQKLQHPGHRGETARSLGGRRQYDR